MTLEAKMEKPGTKLNVYLPTGVKKMEVYACLQCGAVCYKPLGSTVKICSFCAALQAR